MKNLVYIIFFILLSSASLSADNSGVLRGKDATDTLRIFKTTADGQLCVYLGADTILVDTLFYRNDTLFLIQLNSSDTLFTIITKVDSSISSDNADSLGHKAPTYYLNTDTTTQTKAGNFTLENALIVDSATLVVDTANHRVGIGKTNPDVKLEVNGNVKVGTSTGTILEGNANWESGDFIIQPFDNLSAESYYGWKYDGTGTDKGDCIFFLYSYAPNPERMFRLYDNNADVNLFVIKLLSGNVGVATSFPSARLQIQGTSDSVMIDTLGNIRTTGYLADGKGADIASAATITVTHGTHDITGTADIDSIVPGFIGQEVTLQFDGTKATNGVVDGKNLKLSGTFAYTPDDILVLKCIDGSNWFEINRSMN